MIRRLAAILLALLAPSAAFARSSNLNCRRSCSPTSTPLSSADTDITATIAVSCTGLPLTTVRICPSIGAGSGGATSSARQMTGGTSTLSTSSTRTRGEAWLGLYNWALPGIHPRRPCAGAQRHREHQSHDLRWRFGGRERCRREPIQRRSGPPTPISSMGRSASFHARTSSCCRSTPIPPSPAAPPCSAIPRSRQPTSALAARDC